MCLWWVVEHDLKLKLRWKFWRGNRGQRHAEFCFLQLGSQIRYLTQSITVFVTLVKLVRVAVWVCCRATSCDSTSMSSGVETQEGTPSMPLSVGENEPKASMPFRACATSPTRLANRSALHQLPIASATMLPSWLRVRPLVPHTSHRSTSFSNLSTVCWRLITDSSDQTSHASMSAE